MVQHQNLIGLQGQHCVCLALIVAEFDLVGSVIKLYYRANLTAYQSLIG